GIWRWSAPLVVIVSIGVTGSWIAVAETLRDYADSPDWPSTFAWTSTLVWTAVTTVVAVNCVDATRGTAASPDAPRART
ncbi:MAG: hypothetical protein AAFP84_19325, partial [Actinomycetota bacterium]